MSIQKLSSGAELCIQAMHLESQEEEIVRNCVSRYSTPSTFCETLAWIVYRIQNAIKSIIGFSDWQIAKKTIEDRILAIFSKLEKKCGQDLENAKIYPFILETVHSLAYDTANRLLPFCFSLHQNRTESSEEVKAEAEKVSFSTRFKEFLNISLSVFDGS